MGFWNCLFDWMYFDTPQIPWRWGMWEVESLFENRHTLPLAKFLETKEPQLLAQWFASVAPAAAQARQAEITLDNLRLQRNQLAAKLAELQVLDTEEADFSQRDRTLQVNYWEWLLTIGLSLMLFVGIAEILLQLDLSKLSSKKMPLFYLALLGAICLTAGAKLMVIRWVKATRSYEPKRNFFDDPNHANPIPFWSRLTSGDSAVWLSLAIVVLEVAFAAPGFIEMLPHKLQKQLLIQMTAFLGTGIAAMINIGLAWGTALNEIRLEQELTNVRTRQLELTWQQAKQGKIDSQRQTEVVKVLLKALTQDLKEQQRIAKDLRKRARLEHERWEVTVKRRFRKWLNSHPKKWESFKEFSSQENTPNGNQTFSRNIREVDSDEQQ
ncbi:hypothetical protein [Fischerella sp. JS2]|uniref:hypothetical protein n=1 Tax=Fischerella sp. JS2 TaxID=2597771 RepID=UPI0028EDB054|nr:hypothetical protein [Fischerella sp. JS2]